jgi:cytosine/adenosine deaminase-related metal-dependent hydrolase
VTYLFTDVFVYGHDGVSGPTDVLVEGQRIAAVGAIHPVPDCEVIHGRSRHLLVPGLINAHFHSPANHLKGLLASMPLEMFMLYESPQSALVRPTPREAYLRTMIAAVEMLRKGTTSVQDDAFLMPHPEPEIIDAIMQAYQDCGIRAAVALDQPELAETEKLPFLRDIRQAEIEEPLPMSSADLLAHYDYLFTKWHGAAGGRLTGAVSISAPQRVSPEYFQALDDLSRAYHVPLYAHMLETKVQRVLADAQPRFGGRSLVRYTSDLGLLNERTNVIHAIWVDDADLDLIAESNAVVAHNPVSNLRLGSGVMPFRAMRQRGIPIALGVDEAPCGDTLDMWHVVRMAGLIHNITSRDNADWPAAGEVLGALWAGGAAAMLKTGDLGHVRAGALADLVLIDLQTLAFTPRNDITVQLVYCESGTSVRLTMVDGAVVFRDGRVTTVDETSLVEEALELFASRADAQRLARLEADRLLPVYQEVVRRASSVDVGMSRWVEGP